MDTSHPHQRRTAPPLLSAGLGLLLAILPPAVAHAFLTDTVSISASNVPLAEVLRRLARQGDFALALKPAAQEPVSFHAANEPPAAALERLLADYNFVLLFRDQTAARIGKLIVTSRKNPERPHPAATAPTLQVVYEPANGLAGNDDPALRPAGVAAIPPAAEPDSHTATLSREQFAEAAASLFSGTDLETAPLAIHSADGFFQMNRNAGGSGVRLKTLPEESPLRRLGLAAGDLVREIDMVPVQSIPDLEQALRDRAAQEGLTPVIIGIERPAAEAAPVGAPQRRPAPRPMHLYVQLAP